MPKTIYYVASSLDGFIADADNRIDWLLQFGFEPFQEHYDAFISTIGALVMGSATYEFVQNEGPDAWTYDVPAWVLSSRELTPIEGADIRFSSADVAAVHAAAAEAAAGRDIWVVGGGNVAAQFARAGLLDELHVTVMPIALGAGVPLLPFTGTTEPLTLSGAKHFDGGAVELRYALSRAL